MTLYSLWAAGDICVTDASEWMGSRESFACLYHMGQIILLCHHFALDNGVCASSNPDTTFSFYAIIPYLTMLPCLLCASAGPTCTLVFYFQFTVIAITLTVIYITLNRITLFPYTI